MGSMFSRQKVQVTGLNWSCCNDYFVNFGLQSVADIFVSYRRVAGSEKQEEREGQVEPEEQAQPVEQEEQAEPEEPQLGQPGQSIYD